MDYLLKETLLRLLFLARSVDKNEESPQYKKEKNNMYDVYCKKLEGLVNLHITKSHVNRIAMKVLSIE